MCWQDHEAYHFHDLYAEHEAVIDIRMLEVMRGSLSHRALSLVIEGGLGTMRSPASSEENSTASIAPNVPRRVTQVEALEAFRPHVNFVDGLQGEVKIGPLIQSGNASVFATLHDLKVFEQVFLAHGVMYVARRKSIWRRMRRTTPSKPMALGNCPDPRRSCPSRPTSAPRQSPRFLLYSSPVRRRKKSERKAPSVIGKTLPPMGSDPPD